MNRVVKDFKADATGGKTIHLKSLRGKKVVIYFYPKDSTPGCTTESQDFRDLHTKFRRQNARSSSVYRGTASHRTRSSRPSTSFRSI